MERSYTDFLVSDCTFLMGAATVFSLAGTGFIYNRSGSPALADGRAIRQDFAMIGQDVHDVAHALEANAQQLELGL